MHQHRRHQVDYEEAREDAPDDSRLDDVLAVLVNRLEHVRRLRLLLGLDRCVQVDADLLRLEVYTTVSAFRFQATESRRDILGFKSY